MFFKQYYKDIFSRLNRDQRISFQLIHSTIDLLNKKNDDLAKFTEDIYKEFKLSKNNTEIDKLGELWGERVIILYNTIFAFYCNK